MDLNIDFGTFVDTIANEMYLSQDQVDSIVDQTLDEVSFQFSQTLSKVAGESLRGSRSDYINNIYQVKLGKGQYEVGIRGWLANSIESGMSSFDMKQGFAQSSKVKYTKDGGWYLTIPFRFANPSALATSPMFSSVLPKPIYKAAKSVLQTKKSLTEVDVPAAFRKAQDKARSLNGQQGTYRHKSSIYKGLSESKKDNHGQLHTFRRVSSNSDNWAWIHPGIKAHNFFEEALQKMQIDQIVDNTIRNQIGE